MKFNEEANKPTAGHWRVSEGCSRTQSCPPTCESSGCCGNWHTQCPRSYRAHPGVPRNNSSRRAHVPVARERKCGGKILATFGGTGTRGHGRVDCALQDASPSSIIWNDPPLPPWRTRSLSNNHVLALWEVPFVCSHQRLHFWNSWVIFTQPIPVISMSSGGRSQWRKGNG